MFMGNNVLYYLLRFMISLMVSVYFPSGRKRLIYSCVLGINYLEFLNRLIYTHKICTSGLHVQAGTHHVHVKLHHQTSVSPATAFLYLLLILILKW